MVFLFLGPLNWCRPRSTGMGYCYCSCYFFILDPITRDWRNYRCANSSCTRRIRTSSCDSTHRRVGPGTCSSWTATRKSGRAITTILKVVKKRVVGVEWISWKIIVILSGGFVILKRYWDGVFVEVCGTFGFGYNYSSREYIVNTIINFLYMITTLIGFYLCRCLKAKRSAIGRNSPLSVCDSCDSLFCCKFIRSVKKRGKK